jgi:hypothetical protein
MRYKNKSEKGKAADDKAIIASVTREMSRPRMTESARIKLDKQIRSKDGVTAFSHTPFTEIITHLRREHFPVKLPPNS